MTIINEHVVFEHAVRDAIRKAIIHFDNVVESYGMSHLSVSVSYEHSKSDGMWQVYSYCAGNSVDTRGAILHDTMMRHCNAVVQSVNASKLPSLIAGPSSSIPGSEDL